jgi:ABC-type uncharacterized transport system ATPase subunit
MGPSPELPRLSEKVDPAMRRIESSAPWGDTDAALPGNTPVRLKLSGIRKIYPSVVANDGIDLAVRCGEIHAVLGENGAGKSTLMKIIYGAVRPDDGEIRWEGQPVTIANPARARQLGIGMVFQHLALFETLTVAENIVLAMGGDKSLDSISRRIVSESERYGFRIEPNRLVHSLSMGERQRVEIIRCLLQDPNLLILDEPTSVLTPQAVLELFEILRKLASEGHSILYISHKLKEVKALCHIATILRAGKVSGVCDPRTESHGSLARMMIGSDLPSPRHAESSESGDEALFIAGLSRPSDDPFGTALKDICLSVRRGEIVGIAGISGNGQQALLEAVSGEWRAPEAVKLRICGVKAGHLGPLERRKLGMCFVPEERLGRGAVPELSLVDNCLLTASHNGMVWSGMILTAAAKAFAQRCIRDFAVMCGGVDVKAKSLSGGNLQRFIVGRELLQRPKLLIISQPTWGLDVGAAAFILETLVAVRNDGTAIVMISEELDELFEICDRIAVIANGRLSPAKLTREASIEEIGLLMGGVSPPHSKPLSAGRDDA